MWKNPEDTTLTTVSGLALTVVRWPDIIAPDTSPHRKIHNVTSGDSYQKQVNMKDHEEINS